MSYRDQILSLVAFVRTNSRGMLDVMDRDIALTLMELLVKDGMSAKPLAQRALFSRFPEKLLEKLSALVADRQQRDEIIDAVVKFHIKEQRWELDEDIDFAACLVRFLDRLEDMTYMLEKHSGVLFGLRDLRQSVVDTYWAHEFRLRIENKDFARAWDTVKRAHLGFQAYPHVRECGQSPINAMLQGDNRAHGASDNTLRAMVMELFAKLVELKRIPTIREADLAISDFRTLPDKSSPDCGNPQGKWYPGLPLARRFRKNDSEGKEPLHLLPEGAMVLKLAEYFNGLRNKKTRDTAKQLRGLKDALKR